MTEADLRKVMKYHLRNFNDEGVEINDKTIHGDVLSDDDGFGQANSKAIYKAAIRWTFWKAQQKEPNWPDNWMRMTVTTLANRLLAAT